MWMSGKSLIFSVLSEYHNLVPTAVIDLYHVL